jgi:hypothetical protein
LPKGEGQQGGEVVGGDAGAIAGEQGTSNFKPLVELGAIEKFALLHMCPEEIRE